MTVDRLWLAGLLLALALGACGPTVPVATRAVPPTPVPGTATPAGREWEAPLYQAVEIPEPGLSLQAPVTWQRLEPEWAWTPDDTGQARVGVTWADIQPPAQPEALLLPQNSQILQSDPVELSWGSGRRFIVEVYAAAPGGDTKAPVQSVEAHVLIVVNHDGARRAYDFYAAGRDGDGLAGLQPVLDVMLNSAGLRHAPGSAQGVQTGLEAALADRLAGDPAGLCEWEVWGSTGRDVYVWAVCQSPSGTAASAPAVVHFDAAGALSGVDLPRDGALYGDDVRRLFPSDVQERIFNDEFDASAALARIRERAAEGSTSRVPDGARYTSEAFLVSFEVPEGWQPVPGYEERYGGPDGFVQLGGIAGGGQPLGAVCEREAHHKLQPYGSGPEIEPGEIQGQEACWIWPSEDQPVDMEGTAAVIVPFLEPVVVGPDAYDYLVLWGDEGHLRNVAASLNLVPMGQ